jgi:carbohydrate-selective porin OprB
MRKIAALLSAAVAIWPASSVFAVDLMTKASQQEQVSQDSPNLQSLPGLGQQSFVFGDWGGLRSWLNNKGIDLGLSYLSEPAWNLAGGIAPGGTYAGQENLSLDLNWQKLANINGFSTIGWHAPAKSGRRFGSIDFRMWGLLRDQRPQYSKNQHRY